MVGLPYINDGYAVGQAYERRIANLGQTRLDLRVVSLTTDGTGHSVGVGNTALTDDDPFSTAMLDPIQKTCSGDDADSHTTYNATCANGEPEDFDAT